MNHKELKLLQNAVRTALKEVGMSRISQEEFFGTNQPVTLNVKLAA